MECVRGEENAGNGCVRECSCTQYEKGLRRVRVVCMVKVEFLSIPDGPYIARVGWVV